MVYTSSPSGGVCAVTAVAVASGATTVVDDDCVDAPGASQSFYRNMVGVSDGSALYYTVRVELDTGAREWRLRAAVLGGSTVATIRKHVTLALALSQDGNLLAYNGGDSLLVRDLATGVETYLAGRGAFPLVFSVEVVRRVKCRSGQQQRSIPAGTQAMVTSIDSMGRLSLWIAEPWPREWGSIPAVYMVDDIAGLRIKPDEDVSPEVRSQTLAARDVWNKLEREHIEAQAARIFGAKSPEVSRVP